MKSELVRTLTTTFEGHAQKTDSGLSSGSPATCNTYSGIRNGATSPP
jgi:hypothetical protein